MSINKDEYLMLRQEIMDCYKSIDTTRNILYVSMAAILTFSFSIPKEPLILLVAYIVIMPIYLLNLNTLSAIHRAAGYLIVFHESEFESFKWETRLSKLGVKTSGKYWTFQTPYLLSSIGITSLFLYQFISIA